MDTTPLWLLGIFVIFFLGLLMAIVIVDLRRSKLHRDRIGRTPHDISRRR